MDTAFTAYAVGYADQTESNHSELVKAVGAGALEAASENRLPAPKNPA